MTLLGIDFDNTLVNYDNLFYKLALEEGLIDELVPAKKIAIREYLNQKGLDSRFTKLQGEVYGLRIIEADPAPGMLRALKQMSKIGVQMVVVSHKTKKPYSGVQYDLHKAAMSWLEKHSFFSSQGLNWNVRDVFFEESKNAKISRIEEINCTHFIDDLPEVLDMLNPRIKKYLYYPHEALKHTHEKGGSILMKNWNELETLIGNG